MFHVNSDIIRYKCPSTRVPDSCFSETVDLALNSFTLLYVVPMETASILTTSITPAKRRALWLIYVEGPKVKRDILFLAINLMGICGLK